MEKNPRSTQVTGIHSPPVLLLAFVGTARILHGLPQRAHGSRARIVLTGMAGIVLTGMAGIVPTILLHFLHPDNCSCIVLPFDIPVGRLAVRRRRYESKARIVPDNPLAFPPSRQLLLHCSTFLHPCRSPGGQKDEVDSVWASWAEPRKPAAPSSTNYPHRPRACSILCVRRNRF